MISSKNKIGVFHLIMWPLFIGLLFMATPLPGQDTDKKSGVPEGYMIIEGDIIVPVDFYERQGRSAWRENFFWPDGIVPYEFDVNVTPANQANMLNAMAEWERVSCVDFIQRTVEADYVHIQDADENSSYVGRVGGEQEININAWGNRYTICHELEHALGFWHEQSRPDRDDYVQINWDNIIPGKENNFERHGDAGQYGPYDFGSMMHYSQCAFSICTTLVDPPFCVCNSGADPTSGPTITVLPPNQAWQTLIGQRNQFSHWDTLTVGFIYPRSADWRFLDNDRGGLHPDVDGSFLLPYLLFDEAYEHVPEGGTIWITVPANYNTTGVFTKAVILRASLGNVNIGIE